MRLSAVSYVASRQDRRRGAVFAHVCRGRRRAAWPAWRRVALSPPPRDAADVPATRVDLLKTLARRSYLLSCDTADTPLLCWPNADPSFWHAHTHVAACVCRHFLFLIFITPHFILFWRAARVFAFASACCALHSSRFALALPHRRTAAVKVSVSGFRCA